MEWLLLIGRIIFGGFFVFNGLNHFMNLGLMGEYALSKGTPAPKVAVAGTGVMLLVGGLSVVLGVLPVIGLILIVLFLVPVAVVMHNFWAVPEDHVRSLRLAAGAFAFAISDLMGRSGALKDPGPNY